MKSSRYTNVGIVEHEIGQNQEIPSDNKVFAQNTPYKTTAKASYRTASKSPQQNSARSFEKKKEKRENDYQLSYRQDNTTRDNTVRKSSYRENMDNSQNESSFAIQNIINNSTNADVKQEAAYYFSRELETIDVPVKNKAKEPESYKTAHVDISISSLIPKKEQDNTATVEITTQSLTFDGQPEQDQEKSKVETAKFQNPIINKGINGNGEVICTK